MTTLLLECMIDGVPPRSRLWSHLVAHLVSPKWGDPTCAWPHVSSSVLRRMEFKTPSAFECMGAVPYANSAGRRTRERSTEPGWYCSSSAGKGGNRANAARGQSWIGRSESVPGDEGSPFGGERSASPAVLRAVSKVRRQLLERGSGLRRFHGSIPCAFPPSSALGLWRTCSRMEWFDPS